VAALAQPERGAVSSVGRQVGWARTGLSFQETTVDSFKHVINNLLQLLIQLGDVIVGWIVIIENALREQLMHLGVAPPLQTIILLALAVILILGALKLFGGLIRVAVVLVLILIALHVLMPILHH
jgi:hypothetical protein